MCNADHKCEYYAMLHHDLHLSEELQETEPPRLALPFSDSKEAMRVATELPPPSPKHPLPTFPEGPLVGFIYSQF